MAATRAGSEVGNGTKSESVAASSQRNQFGCYGDSVDDLYAKHGFEKLQIGGLRDIQPSKKRLNIILPADILDRSLSAERCRAGQDED